MQKTTTRKDFKVYLLKTFLSILILGISFQVSFAQQQKALSKPASATKGLPTERPAVTPAATTSVRPSNRKAFAGAVGATLVHGLAEDRRSFQANRRRDDEESADAGTQSGRTRR